MPKDYSRLLGAPGFPDALFKLHFQLYQGYVKNTNLLTKILKKTMKYLLRNTLLGHLARGVSLLVMDVFEHAYITVWGVDRQTYIDAFFKNIEWAVCSDRFDHVYR